MSECDDLSSAGRFEDEARTEASNAHLAPLASCDECGKPTHSFGSCESCQSARCREPDWFELFCESDNDLHRLRRAISVVFSGMEGDQIMEDGSCKLCGWSDKGHHENCAWALFDGVHDEETMYDDDEMKKERDDSFAVGTGSGDIF